MKAETIMIGGTRGELPLRDFYGQDQPFRTAEQRGFSPPVRVIVTANTLWNITNYRLNLVRTLRERGFEVILLAPKEEQMPALKTDFEHVDLNVTSHGVSIFQNALVFFRFIYVFATYKPDIVLSFTVKNNVFGGIAAKLFKIPFIPNVSGRGASMSGRKTISFLVRALSKLAFRSMPLVMFQNKEDASFFTDKELVKENAVRLLPGSGIDLEWFDPRPLPSNEKTVFLFFGRLLWSKGVKQFVDAARLLKKDDVKAECWILGYNDKWTGETVDKAQLERWQNEGIIRYRQWSNDVRPSIAQADCVVLPSAYGEGVPRSLLEAASMGRPIITTDTPGCRDVVDSEKNGFFCKPGDAVGLAKVMKAIHTAGHDRRRSMGAQSRLKAATTFDDKIVINAYMSAIAELVENHESSKELASLTSQS